jgi:hypothetical protein
MPYRRKRPEPPKPSPPPAVSELMRDEFEAKPFAGEGGVRGEWAVPQPQPPPPPAPQPFNPPPPDWDLERQEREARERAAEEKKARKVLADKAKREGAAVSTTVSATLGRLGGVSARYDAYGTLAEAVAFDDLDSELGGVALDVDHSHEHRIGEVVYVEVSPEGQIGLVAVADGDWIQEAASESPVYISGEYVTRNRSSAGAIYTAERGALIGAAVTWDPARLDARAARLWPGDVRRSIDRRSWPISFASQDPLLGRAVDHGTWATEVPRVVDRRFNPSNPLGLKPGDPAPVGSYRSNDLPRGLRRGPPGRILSIR